MNAFQKLTRESRKFYLTAIGLMLFFVICDTVFICRDSKIAFMDSSVEQKIGEEIQRIQDSGGFVEIPKYGMNLVDVFKDKANNFQLMGFFVTMIGIIVLLIARKFYYIDVRAKEFYKMLPVKERIPVLYDYLLILLIILTGALVQGVILTGALTNYNQTWVTLVTGDSGGAAARDMIHAANEYTLIYMLYYFLFIVVVYTWIYLGVTVTKNPIVGVFSSSVIWYMFWWVWDNSSYLFFCWTGRETMVIEDEVSTVDHISTFIESFLSPIEFFYYLDWESRTITAYDSPGYSMWLNVAATVIFTVFLIILIFLCANRRDLTKGRLFYFPLLDYSFAVLCGLGICLFLLDNWGGFALIAGWLITTVWLYLLIHPYFRQKSDNWEVR